MTDICMQDLMHSIMYIRQVKFAKKNGTDNTNQYLQKATKFFLLTSSL